jgi:predicted amidohydrolase YtcJ
VSYVRVIEAQATLDALTSVGLRSGYGDEWLRLGGVKVSIDGSCTFKNAAVYDAYPGEPDNFGIVRIEQDELDEVVRAADTAGLAIAVHAIGPRAVDMALDAFSRVPAAVPGTGLPHRIEHAYVSPGRDRLQRMRDLGLVLSTQPAFIHAVGDIWADILAKRKPSAWSRCARRSTSGSPCWPTATARSRRPIRWSRSPLPSLG